MPCVEQPVDRSQLAIDPWNGFLCRSGRQEWAAHLTFCPIITPATVQKLMPAAVSTKPPACSLVALPRLAYHCLHSLRGSEKKSGIFDRPQKVFMYASIG